MVTDYKIKRHLPSIHSQHHTPDFWHTNPSSFPLAKSEATTQGPQCGLCTPKTSSHSHDSPHPRVASNRPGL